MKTASVEGRLSIPKSHLMSNDGSIPIATIEFEPDHRVVEMVVGRGRNHVYAVKLVLEHSGW